MAVDTISVESQELPQPSGVDAVSIVPQAPSSELPVAVNTLSIESQALPQPSGVDAATIVSQEPPQSLEVNAVAIVSQTPSSEMPVEVADAGTFVSQSMSSEMPTGVDEGTIVPQAPPPWLGVNVVTVLSQQPSQPSPAPGQTVPPSLPLPTPAASPVKPTALDPAASAPPGGSVVDDCSRCFLFFPSVYVYYWPVASPNTDCLSLVPSKTLPPIPSGHLTYFSILLPLRDTLLTVILAHHQVSTLSSPH